jgi:hypothetical protein
VRSFIYLIHSIITLNDQTQMHVDLIGMGGDPDEAYQRTKTWVLSENPWRMSQGDTRKAVGCSNEGYEELGKFSGIKLTQDKQTKVDWHCGRLGPSMAGKNLQPFN